MKILHSWLMEYIDAPLGVEDLVSKLTRLGFNIEEMKKTGASFTGVSVGQILKIEKHPNADKLSLCEVNDGAGTMRVVCGARNIAVGQKIPFARVGAELSEGVLKKAKIRGVESEGMICSAAELGLEGYDSTGILVLPDTAQVGVDAKTLFPKADYVFEVEITPNLAYCLSHYALARELCVFYGLPLKKPVCEVAGWDSKQLWDLSPDVDAIGMSLGDAADKGKGVGIWIVNSELCQRYAGVVVKNAAALTPEWMASRLRAVGVNPKGDLLIDVSNYVMLELGQPIHCFDLARLAGPEIRVRTARPAETMKTLDNQDFKLSEDMLVIADKDVPVALAGVMGGLGSAVSGSTKDILIESANFSPASIRKTSKKTGLKSDSSYRFERGVDPELQLRAALRVAKLVLDSAPGAKVLQIADNYPRSHRHVPKVIEVLPERVNAILGTKIPEKDIFACLKAIQPELSDGKPWQFTVPGYRRDIESVWDIAEEAARYIGYESIPSASGMPTMLSSVAPSFAVVSELKARLAGLGFSEVYNYDFISLKDFRNCLLNEEEAVALKNPLSAEFQLLRTSMVAGALKTLTYNLNRGRNSVSIFEVGNIFKKTKGGHCEETICAGLMFGAFPDSEFWRGGNSTADFYHLKGVMNSVFAGRGGFRFEKATGAPAYFHPGACLEMKLGNSHAGWLGLLNPAAARNSDLKDNQIWYFELPLKALVAAHKPEFWQRAPQVKAVSSFPNIWRDLSVVLEDKFEWAEIEAAIAKAPDLSTVKLIDVYKGKNIGENLKSITIRFTFSSMEKTLTDAEINAHISAILLKLSLNFGAKLRS